MTQLEAGFLGKRVTNVNLENISRYLEFYLPSQQTIIIIEWLHSFQIVQT